MTQGRCRVSGRDATATCRCRPVEDRKSTRLNSSHANISYAVFCLKKKKKTYRVHAMQVYTTLYYRPAPPNIASIPRVYFELALPHHCNNHGAAPDPHLAHTRPGCI